MRRNQVSAFALGIFVFLWVSTGSAAMFAQCKVAWDPSPSEEVSNYFFIIGSRSGIGDLGHYSIGNVTNLTVDGLRVGVTYYFTVTAANSVEESGPSNEVPYRPAAPSSGAGTVLRVIPPPPPQVLPQLMIAKAGNDIVLTFGGSGSWNYTIERCFDLRQNQWSVFNVGSLNGWAYTNRIIDWNIGAATNNAAFYRLKAFVN